MPDYSPWGYVDYKKEYAPGFYLVGTPGHGGYMLSFAFARKNLSEAAIKKAERYGDWLCYEEDCLYAVVDWELPEFWPEMWPYREKTKEEVHEHLFRTLSASNPDYLLELGGVLPDPELYKQWQEFQEMMRSNRTRG